MPRQWPKASQASKPASSTSSAPVEWIRGNDPNGEISEHEYALMNDIVQRFRVLAEPAGANARIKTDVAIVFRLKDNLPAIAKGGKPMSHAEKVFLWAKLDELQDNGLVTELAMEYVSKYPQYCAALSIAKKKDDNGQPKEGKYPPR